MGENFKRFKIKAKKTRIAKSVMAALASGLLVFGVLGLLFSFEVAELDAYLRVLLSIGAACISFFTVWFANGTSDKAIARMLDRELLLKERAVTMLGFLDEDTSIYELQRMDADAALEGKNVKGFGTRSVPIYLTALVLSLGVFVSALVVKAPEAPPVDTDEPFSITELQAAAIEELISYVRDSRMDFPYRENIALSIEDLLASLRDCTTEREKDVLVADTMSFIYAQTDISSYALELMVSLWQSDIDACKRLAEVLNYYSWPRADEYDRFSSALEGFRVSIAHPGALDETPDETLMRTETQLLYLKLASAIPDALDKSKIHNEDSLYTVLSRLASADENREDGTRVWGFSTLAEYIADAGYSDAERELGATLTALGSELFRSLEDHKVNTDTGEYAMKRLGDILGSEVPEFKRPGFIDGDGGASFPGDGEGGGGAIGGDLVFGGDDTVLDPLTGKYVKYWEILGRYASIMQRKLEEGGLSDAERHALEKYFDILYNGFEDSDKD